MQGDTNVCSNNPVLGFESNCISFSCHGSRFQKDLKKKKRTEEDYVTSGTNLCMHNYLEADI
jgi:hypothetical protein